MTVKIKIKAAPYIFPKIRLVKRKKMGGIIKKQKEKKRQFAAAHLFLFINGRPNN